MTATLGGGGVEVKWDVIGRWVRLILDVQGQAGERILYIDGQVG